MGVPKWFLLAHPLYKSPPMAADAGVSEVPYYSHIIMTARARNIGVDFALWAKKLCQEAEESVNGLKRESATD